MAEWKKVVVSGSAISQLQNDSNYLVSGDSGVELTGSFKGDGSQLTGVTSDQTGEALTDGSGISDFTFDGSTAVSISVQNDGSTLTVGGGGVKVTDAGITATQLAASVAGNGLSGGAGTALSVNTDGTSITTSGDSLTLAGTAFSSSVDSRIDANASAIAGLDGNYATDAELSAVSSSASADATSKADAAQAAAIASAEAKDVVRAAAANAYADQAEVDAIASAEAKDVVRATAANAYADQAELDAVSTANSYTDTEVSSLSGSAHTQRVAIETSLDGKIGTEKGRIDAILTASVADTDTFAEIVSLINSVDTTNDQAFAGFVTSSNGRATAIEGSVTSLSGSAAAANALIISDVSANSASIAALDGNYATDSSVTALSGSAHIARASVASDASAARLVLENSVEFTTDALQENIDQNTQVIGTNMQAINSISTVAIPQVFSQIGTEKARIDAILSASVADTDSFAEIVSLINSVDTTNDQAFAGFVTSSNAAQAVQDGRLTSIEAFTASIDAAYASEGQLTALSSSAAAANAAIIVNVSSNALDIEELYTFNEDHDDRITAAQSLATTNSAFIATNTAAIGDLEDGISATDSSVTALSGSAHTARGVVASNATGEVSALSGSANIARGVVASNAYNTTLAVSSSILVVTDALDGRIDTLEGVSHSHSNKANLDQINQDLGTSDNVNFNDLVVDGNLTVSGTTTTVNTANLLVEDKFILLNSGSADPDEGGIIIDEGAGSGHAFIYDKGDTRWGFNASVAQDASTANATAHAAAVVDMQNVAHADSAEYQKNGNIKVDAGSIFIYC